MSIQKSAELASEIVESLCVLSANQKTDALSAMHFSQAAVNVANAMSQVLYIQGHAEEGVDDDPQPH